jgi:hypothetical protein
MAKESKDTASKESAMATEGLPEMEAPLVSEIDAKKYVDKNFTVPKGINRAFVTSDRSVFFDEYEGQKLNAVNHSIRHNLKLFEVSWD